MINKRLGAILSICVLTCGLAAGVYAAPGKFTVQADELDYDLKSGQAVGIGHVVIIQDNAKTTADHATFNSKTKSGVLKGNVIADRDNQHLSCNEFHLINENEYTAIGDVDLSQDGKHLYAPQVNYSKITEYAVTEGSWARLKDADGSTLEAVKIVYDGKAGLATATGGVTVRSDARKLTASGDKAIYDTKKDGFVELLGNAEATQDGNTVKGDKLRLTNSNVAVGDGNVSVTYLPQGQPAQDRVDAVADTKVDANADVKVDDTALNGAVPAAVEGKEQMALKPDIATETATVSGRRTEPSKDEAEFLDQKIKLLGNKSVTLPAEDEKNKEEETATAVKEQNPADVKAGKLQPDAETMQEKKPSSEEKEAK